ncbi:MAG: PD40 domain-containing protein [Bacteroidia bacterium]|nr:PD40 domain-containing protein [Bacteroidia bacterium]
MIVILLPSVISAQQQDTLSSFSSSESKELPLLKSQKKFIYFISNRLSDDDKFDVFKAIPGSSSPSLVVIRGHFQVIGNANEKKAKISVYNSTNNELIGIYNTSQFTGNYLMILAPDIKYMFKVEVAGYGTMQEIVEIPLKIDYEICQQNISIKLNEKQKPMILINNYFADENEKVFYLRTNIDTAKLYEVTDVNNLIKQVDKHGNLYANIDELVKKQQSEEQKKPQEALAAYNAGNYQLATTLYEPLLKNDPLDPFLNYYYGVSLFKSNGNKAKAINALQVATGIKEIPADVYLYLGQAFHLSYLFQDAIKAFNQYKARVKPYDFEGNNGPQLINNCFNGTMFLSNQENIEVLNRTPVQFESILSNYNPDLVNEIVKLKPEIYYSDIDKKKQIPLWMCASKSNEIYQVSYGTKDQKHTDLYKNTKLPNGTMSAPQYIGIGPEINSPYDENYPYLSKDGLTLYFSSKGHNSMGGYDIFKCIRKDSASAWSKPINLGYPINSTYDDIMYIPDEGKQTASYCSNRKNASYEYLQISFPKDELQTSIIKGWYNYTDTTKKDAYITVYNSNTGEISGVYKSNTLTGKYLMILPSGTKYEMLVEVNGVNTFTTTFEIPVKKKEFELKQMIKLSTDKNNNALSVNNYFTEQEASKVVFESEVPMKNIDAKTVQKQNKILKVKRTPEEMLKDKEDLDLALKLFEQATYQEAALIYQNLNLYIDLSVIDTYRYGVCLFNTKKDKSECINLFSLCEDDKNIPIEVYYYLAKANQLSYRFSTAINYYKKYMAVCKPEDVKAWKLEQEMVYCQNGMKLIDNPVILEVYNRKHIDLDVIQNSFTNLESGGKVLVVTEDMQTELDKKNAFKSLLYLSSDKNMIVYSSYGNDEKKGKDIYLLKKLSNGKWAPQPQNLTDINTEFDEEYPALSKDGKILYFSSKGHNTMGGYDIFKSEWNEKTETWSKPVNLGSPLNSPYDDMYFLE